MFGDLPSEFLKFEQHLRALIEALDTWDRASDAGDVSALRSFKRRLGNELLSHMRQGTLGVAPTLQLAPGQLAQAHQELPNSLLPQADGRYIPHSAAGVLVPVPGQGLP